MATNKNYFSSRISIETLRVDQGLPSTPAIIQRVGKTVVRSANTGQYPAYGDNTYQMTGTRGVISVSVSEDDLNNYTGDTRLEAPGHIVGAGIIPTGTLAYFPRESIPYGWVALGDPFTPWPLVRRVGWIDEANAVPLYADTEYKAFYEILQSWDLIRSTSYAVDGGVFLTKDPFNGYFIRCLNPYCEGVDANNQPLSTQTHTFPRHTHNGKSFKTMPFPHSWYSVSSPSVGSVNDPNIELVYKTKLERINHYRLLIIDQYDDVINYAGTGNPIPDTIYYGDKITWTFTSDGRAENARLFGQYGYDGGLDPIDDRNVTYYVNGVKQVKTTIDTIVHPAWEQYLTSYAANSGKTVQIVFEPKTIESETSVFLYRYHDRFSDRYSTSLKKEVKIISYENSDIIDKGRTPFWQETIPAGKERFGPFTRAGVGGSPNGITNAFDGSVTYSFGTQYLYNYKWTFNMNWDDPSNGTLPVTMDNFFTPPFRITDRKDRIHSVTDYDNHIHTRVRTIYRSVIDKRYPVPYFPWTGSYWPNSFPDRIDPQVGTQRYYHSTSPTANNDIQFDGTYGVITTPASWISTNAKWGTSEYIISKYLNNDGTNRIRTEGQAQYEDLAGPDQFYKLITQGYHPYSTWQWKTNNFYYPPSVTFTTPNWAKNLADYTAYRIAEISSEESQGGTPSYTNTDFRVTSRGPRREQRGAGNRGLHAHGQQRNSYQSVYRVRIQRTTKWKVNYSRINQKEGRDRYRVLGKLTTLGADFVPYHILKSTSHPADGFEFYNTGSDGLRTSLAGNHHHQVIYDEVFYRGNGEFRPINMALVLCVKW